GVVRGRLRDCAKRLPRHLGVASHEPFQVELRAVLSQRAVALRSLACGIGMDTSSGRERRTGGRKRRFSRPRAGPLARSLVPLAITGKWALSAFMADSCKPWRFVLSPKKLIYLSGVSGT